MQRCFVIQPFNSKFNKRFSAVYEPAIRAAGLEPYRVDADPSVDVPIDAIESEIRESAICLADITEDNPNVWYELGYASAAKKAIVMICSDERQPKKYPFDIQHRTVIPYKVESPQDFDTLREAITVRVKAQLKKAVMLSSIAETESVAAVEGLTQSEMAILASCAGSVTLPEEEIAVYQLKRDVENAGFTGVAFGLGIRRLLAKGFIRRFDAADYNGQEYPALNLTDHAWGWIEANESKFVIKREVQKPDDDEIPF
jgi:hypothetical protein